MAVIYLLTNVVTGKKYVGQTVDLKNRLSWHRCSKATTHLHRSIQKYGWGNFVCSILEEVDEVLLSERERFHIHQQKTLSPDGYNLTEGGEGCPGRYVSEKTKEKIRQKAIGNKRTLGLKRSDEDNQKNRERGKTRWADPVFRAKMMARGKFDNRKGKPPWNKGLKKHKTLNTKDFSPGENPKDDAEN